MSSARAALGCLQVVLGITAHVAATGCLPSTGVLLLLGPVLFGTVLAFSSSETRLPRWTALLAGQSAVHLVLSLAAGCAAAATAAHEPNPLAAAPAGAVVMSAAHLLALAVSVSVTANVETALSVLRRVRNAVAVRRTVPTADSGLVVPSLPAAVTTHRDRLVRWLLPRTPTPARGPPASPRTAWS